MKFLIVSILFFVVASSAFAQGEVKVYRSADIDRMVEMHKVYNANKGEVYGYRIQIISSTTRDEVMNAKSRFLSRYPTVKCYDIFEQPNFKLRVGNFSSKLKATKFLKELGYDFKQAFIIRDYVDVKEL